MWQMCAFALVVRWTAGLYGWSRCGVQVYEMTIGQPPFMGKTEEELFLGIMKKRILYPTWITAECKGIIDRLCTKEVRCSDPWASPKLCAFAIRSNELFSLWLAAEPGLMCTRVRALGGGQG